MATHDTLVYLDVAGKKHTPFAAGDTLAGSLVKLDATVPNSIVVGADGGLLVSPTAVLPDDQVLTGDNSGSVGLTLTPTTAANGDVNYAIKADVKVSTTADNSVTIDSTGIYVPVPVIPSVVVGNAPTTVDDGSTTTVYFGGNTAALGNPARWVKTAGDTFVSPQYNEGSVSGGSVVVAPAAAAAKQVEFGSVADPSSAANIVVTFAKPFAVAPFVTMTHTSTGRYTPGRFAVVTTTGITFKATGSGSGSGTIEWKAEER